MTHTSLWGYLKFHLSRRTSFYYQWCLQTWTDYTLTPVSIILRNIGIFLILTLITSVYVASFVHLSVLNRGQILAGNTSPAALLQVSYFSLEEFFLTRSKVSQHRVQIFKISRANYVWDLRLNINFIWFGFEAFLMVWGFKEHFRCGFGLLRKIEALAALRPSASAWLSCGGPQGFMLGLILASWLYTSLYMCCLGPTNSINVYADDSLVYLPYFKIYGGFL